MTLFQGAGTAMVTPFNDKGVDYSTLADLLTWQISSGINAIISCGTTGEASTLTDKEHIETVKFTVDKVAGRVPVIAGAGSNDTRHAVYMAQQMEKMGVSGLLVVTPYYNKCTQKGLVRHYEKIAGSVNIPVILYSVPSRTGVNISPLAVKELSSHPNICGIKEASGNISQVAEMARYISDDFAIYSGNDDMILPLLALGANGAISTVSNIIPGDVSQMIQKFFDGSRKESVEMQIRMLPLINCLFMEVNPVPVKAALALMKKAEAKYRLPLCEADKVTIKVLKKEMHRYGLI